MCTYWKHKTTLWTSIWLAFSFEGSVREKMGLCVNSQRKQPQKTRKRLDNSCHLKVAQCDSVTEAKNNRCMFGLKPMGLYCKPDWWHSPFNVTCELSFTGFTTINNVQGWNTGPMCFRLASWLSVLSCWGCYSFSMVSAIADSEAGAYLNASLIWQWQT